MSKLTKKFLSEVDFIIHLIVNSMAFMFDVPKEIVRVFLCDQDDNIGWRVIEKYAFHLCKEIKKTGSYTVKNFTISDHGSTIIDMMPIPIPNAQVVTKKGVYRYSGIIFANSTSITVSLHRVGYTENGKNFAGVDLSKKEAKLINDMKYIVGRKLLQNPIIITKNSKPSFSTAKQVSFDNQHSVAEVKRAISNIPSPVLFTSIHCWIASLMPYIEQIAKPFYYPAVRLSDNDAAAEIQTETLRNTLSDYVFNRDSGGFFLPIPELTLQNNESIKTLANVKGCPVLLRIARDAVQRDLTEEMQRAYYEYCALGIADHPLHTVPILIGPVLTAENTLFAINWKAADNVEPGDAQVLYEAVNILFSDPMELADKFSDAMSNLHLHNQKYAVAYFLDAVRFFDRELFGGNGEGILFQKMSALIEEIKLEEVEQLNHFKRATSILQDMSQYEDLIANDAKSMEPKHLGFWYAPNGKESRIAFELKEDFTAFITKRLGLEASDSKPFRQHLQEIGMLDSLTQTVRGRNGDPISHVLINPFA